MSGALINKNKLFNINNVPITFFEIEQWWNKASIDQKIYTGNPYNSERSCYFIAYRVYEQKILNNDQNISRPMSIVSNVGFDGMTNYGSADSIVRAVRNAKPSNGKHNYQQNNYTTTMQTMPTFDWRAALGLPKDIKITEKMVKTYFRKAARKYHPDVNNGDDSKMVQILKARDEAFKELGLI